MTTRTLLLLAAMLVCAGGSIAGAQQLPSQQTLSRLSTPKEFDLSKLACRDFLNASLDDRAYLLMIYWGFEAAKTSNTKFVTADVRDRSQKVVDYCASTPDSTMFAAVEKFAH